MELKAAIDDFATRIQTLLEAQAMEQAKAQILGAFGIGATRKPGRPSKVASAVAPIVKAARRKLPPQYCPVPYCRNLAAPVFGQVCAKHKDVPKTLITKYREERRAKKDGVKPAKSAPTKRAKRVAKKANRAASVAKKVPERSAASATKKAKEGRAAPATISATV